MTILRNMKCVTERLQQMKYRVKKKEVYNLKVKSLMHSQSSYMYMYWVKVPLMMDENNRLAKEQPELEELKREGVPLRMIREQKQDGSERLFIEKLVSN